MKWFLILLLGFLTISVKVNYRNYKVYNIVPNTEEQLQILLDLNEKNIYDFWTECFGVQSVVMVSPTNDMEFRRYVSQSELYAQISVTDVQELIDAQTRSTRSVNNITAGNFSFTTYHELAAIYSWFKELHELYPDVVTIFSIGYSYEGRAIKGVKIDYHATTREGRPFIAIVEGGIHPREWISPATVTGIINAFLTSTDPGVRKLAEAFEWHFIPVLNPDGYVYTFTHNRLWRKNRNPSYNMECPSEEVADASSKSCSETFAGPYVFSEPESSAMAIYVLTQKERGKVFFYIAFHSYGQVALYSHVTGIDNFKGPDHEELFEITSRAAMKLKSKHGTTYATGTSAELLYAVSGVSIDWAKSVARVPYTFLLELRDLGQYAYLLPTEQIIPNNEEVIEWLVEADRVTRQVNYYLEPYSSAATALTHYLYLIISAVDSLFCLD